MEEFATVLVDAIVPQDGEDSTVRSPVGVVFRPSYAPFLHLALPPLWNRVHTLYKIFLLIAARHISVTLLFPSSDFSRLSFSRLPNLHCSPVTCLSPFSDRAPQIVELESNVEWNLNSSPKISCSATGNPLPTHDNIELRKLDSTVLKVERPAVAYSPLAKKTK